MMNPASDSPDTRPVKRLLIAQAVMTVILGVTGLHWSVVIAQSLAAGALIGLAGSAYFARQAFRYRASEDARRAARSFFKGLAGKVVVVAAGFMMALRLLHPVSAGALFLGFALVQLVTWLSPLWIDRN